MDNENVNLQEDSVSQQCAKCKEYEANEESLGIALAIVAFIAFIGPIIGMLIGMFASKKLLEREN